MVDQSAVAEKRRAEGLRLVRRVAPLHSLSARNGHGVAYRLSDSFLFSAQAGSPLDSMKGCDVSAVAQK